MASLAGFRLPDAEDPRVQAQLRKMGVSLEGLRAHLVSFPPALFIVAL
jgi:hypothetical protein